MDAKPKPEPDDRPADDRNFVKSTSSAWRDSLGGALGLVALVALAYWPSFQGGFVWDDLVLVRNNPLATGAMNLKTVWGGADFSLSTVVTWLEWLQFRDHPLGYRLVNALLHAGSVILFWRLLGRLRLPGAWLGAAVFAVHPMAVASVAWISELKNTLSLPFCLLSGWAFLAYEEHREQSKKRAAYRWYGAALGWFGLALLAKTSTVGLPLVIGGGLALRRPLTRRDGLMLMPFFALALGAGALTVWFQTHQAIRGITVQIGSWLERSADAGTAVWFYLWKAVWPTGLCAVYPSWEKALPGLWRFGPLLGLITLFGLAGWRWRRGGKWLGVGLGAFTVCLLPVAGLVDMYFMVFARVSDHFAYLALLVIAAAAGAGLNQVRPMAARWISGGLVVAVLGVLARERATVYASDEALWRDTLRKNPRSWNAHNNLACNLAERGELETAIQHFEQSLELNPNNAAAHLNLAKGLTLVGRFVVAEAHYQRAAELKPEDAEALLAYGQALAENHELARATEQITLAINRKPSTKGRLLLAALETSQNKIEAAAVQYEAVLETEPNQLEALNNLAWIRATAPGQTSKNRTTALELAKKACALSDYQQPMMLGTLAAAFAANGDFSNAVETATSAVSRADLQGDSVAKDRNRRLLQKLEALKQAHLNSGKTRQ